MDPYKPSSSPIENLPAPGGPCPHCGSTNTGPPLVALRKRTNLLFFFLFLWLFLIVGAAFSKEPVICRDCGATWRYKTIGSWIALAIVVIFVIYAILDTALRFHRR